jgi:hypothetical protein
VLSIWNNFFRAPYLNPTFQLVSDPYSDPDPTCIFSNILNKILPLYTRLVTCKCVRLHIMTRYRLFRDFFDKNEFIFFN